MKFVLYNASHYVEKLPKFNYEGDFVLRPNETREITEDMVEFYRPWHSVGIQVRRLQDMPGVDVNAAVVEETKVEETKVEETKVEEVKSVESAEQTEQVETSIPETKEEEIKVESPSVEAKVSAEVRTPQRTASTNKRRGRKSK